ncbi:PREDICTED: protein Shroom4 [Thamnophis sirtalis]|uniref:Protein Shroom4 n=1 Tax=Thamnophis sirtalis TaxID=35019 RepID=A0A6I9X5N3_9SAUR|nr:PREDICTED: protein Shroom4 [Thamnophis sirtalis]
MIIRRRNVPIIRPHSWHLAKLSEVRTDGTAMTFPADPLSLSWHLGCETSDLPLPWNPLSPHCTTEKNSSLGSMESLDPAGQTYYEGSLSPIDQAMDQSKRDSAYSSFSASSSTSDSALRPEETSSVDGAQPGQLPEPRYLQTGGEPAGLGVRLPSSVQSGSLPRLSRTAAAPPHPPVRQDSLRACNSPLEDPRAPTHAGGLCPENWWNSDISLCSPGRDAHGPGGALATTGPLKDSPFPDQYYLLSSHTEPHLGMKRSPQTSPSSLAESPREPAGRKGHEVELNNCAEPPSSWKAALGGPFGHRHSIPEHLLVAQLQALEVSRGQKAPRWTVSPLHKEQKDPQAPEPCGQKPCEPAEELDSPSTAEEGSPSPRGPCTALGRPNNTLPTRAGSPSLPAFGNGSTSRRDLQAAPCVDPLPEAERSLPAAQKGQHRSAHSRRRSDRFATNLRNEIQWRKAQLQKARGPGGPGCEEEPAPQAEESPAHTAVPAPSPPPLGEGRPLGSSGLPAGVPKRWGSELSVFGEERAPSSPQRTPKEKPVARAGGWGGGRWRWSPEHKLQPQESEPGPSAQLPLEEDGLLPFADRRRFFEETSHPLPARPYGSLQGRLEGRRSPEAEKPGSAEHGTFQRHSLDQSYRCPPSPPVYQDFQPEVLRLCKSLARPGVETEHWWALPCSCAVREACAYSFQEECAVLRSRSMPMPPPSHHAHHCHPCSWSCRSDCCCPGQQKLVEDGGPWHGRKPFQGEFPPDEWEPPAVSRASSHTVSQLLPHKVAFTRVSPFWTCFERTEPAGPSFCRAPSTHSLPWDCEQPKWVAEKGGWEGGLGEPHKPPLRERAYSESHLCTEPARVSAREWREAPLAETQETAPKSPACQTRRRGPPPPRPPPPNWEKYRSARASHQQLLPAQACRPHHVEESWAPGQPGFEAARQRSQSLPGEQLWPNRAQLQCPRLPGAGPVAAPSLPEQDNPHYYCHGSPPRTREWLMAETSDRSVPSRTASSSEGAAAEDPPRVEEQETPTGSPSEQPLTWHPQQGTPVSQDAAGECHRSGPPPSRLNSEELMRDVAGKDRSLAGVLSSGFGLRSAAEMALLEKKRQLTAQLEDAKELQEHVAQREQLVSASVSRCLAPEQLQDYQHFVRMKSALAIQQRQLDDKVKLGEEQLRCLWESLPRRPRKP